MAAALPSSRRAFTLLEALVSVAVFALLLGLTIFCIQRMSAARQRAEEVRRLRVEAAESLAALGTDFAAMPIRSDLDYRLGPALEAGDPGPDALCFLVEQTAPLSLRARPDPGVDSRGFSIARYRVGRSAGDGTAWAGLQRALTGLGLNDYFLGQQPPPDFTWPAAVQGADELPDLGRLDPTARDWAPQPLANWPAAPEHFAPVSRQVVALGMAFQLSRDFGGKPAGSIVATPPFRERPAGSGQAHIDLERVGAVVIGLALLPEPALQRRTVQELEALNTALSFPGPEGAPELPAQYWNTLPLEEPLRRELTFIQRSFPIGAGY